MLSEAELIAAWPAMQKVALKFTKNRNSAADLAQDTALRAWEKRAQFIDTGRGAMPWLGTVMFRIYANGIRKSAARPECSLVTIDDKGYDAPQPWVIHVTEVAKALNRLPTRQREVVIAAACGNKYHEISAAYQIAPGTVRSRIKRGRDALRRGLDT